MKNCTLSIHSSDRSLARLWSSLKAQAFTRAMNWNIHTNQNYRPPHEVFLRYRIDAVTIRGMIDPLKGPVDQNLDIQKLGVYSLILII